MTMSIRLATSTFMFIFLLTNTGLFAQDYIWDKEHKCKMLSFYSRGAGATGPDSRTFTYTGECKEGFLSGPCTVYPAFGMDDNEKSTSLTANFTKGIGNGNASFKTSTRRTEGNMKNGKFEGPGKIHFNWYNSTTGVVEAIFANNLPVGDVKVIYPNGEIYKGGIHEDNYDYRKGKGTFFFTSGDRYEGIFKSSDSETGVMIYKDGTRVSGKFKDYSNTEHYFISATGEEIKIVAGSNKISKPNIVLPSTKAKKLTVEEFTENIEYLATVFRLVAKEKEGGNWTLLFGLDIREDFFAVMERYSGKLSETYYYEKFAFDDDYSFDDLVRKFSLYKDRYFKSFSCNWDDITDVILSKDNDENYWITIKAPFTNSGNTEQLATSFRFLIDSKERAMEARDDIQDIVYTYKIWKKDKIND